MSFGNEKGFVELIATTKSFDIHSISKNEAYWSKKVNAGGSYWGSATQVHEVPLN